MITVDCYSPLNIVLSMGHWRYCFHVW